MLCEYQSGVLRLSFAFMFLWHGEQCGVWVFAFLVSFFLVRMHVLFFFCLYIASYMVNLGREGMAHFLEGFSDGNWLITIANWSI